MILRVHANDTKKNNLYKTIQSKVVLDVAFRQRQCNTTELPAASLRHIWRIGVRTAPEKPRYIVIGIQQTRVEIKRRMHHYLIMLMYQK